MDSRFVFITTAPMNEDFEEGRVFSPRYLSGAVFSAYLELLGLGRSSIYLTSASYCRTIMSNDSSEGLKSCMRFKREEFDRLRRAKYFITFGSAPFQMMSGIFGSATSFLGSYFKFEWFEHEAYLIPFPHPAYSADAPYLNDRVLEVMSKMVHE